MDVSRCVRRWTSSKRRGRSRPAASKRGRHTTNPSGTPRISFRSGSSGDYKIAGPARNEEHCDDGSSKESPQRTSTVDRAKERQPPYANASRRNPEGAFFLWIFWNPFLEALESSGGGPKGQGLRPPHHRSARLPGRQLRIRESCQLSLCRPNPHRV